MIGRRRPVPDAVRGISTLDRREAWGLLPDGTPLVATATALYVADAPLRWTQVEKVAWTPPQLVVTEVAEVEGTGAVHTFVLEQEHHLAEVVRARVTSSVGWSDRRRLVPSGSVRLVGRRTPGEDLLTWQVVWEQGTNPDDPLLRAQVEAFVSALRKTIG